eukprot:357270-Chlamydomonas_euryale.AAC.7
MQPEPWLRRTAPRVRDKQRRRDGLCSLDHAAESDGPIAPQQRAVKWCVRERVGVGPSERCAAREGQRSARSR